MLPVKIVSTGCYIPSVKVLSTELDRKFGVEPGTVEKKTGIHTRYYGNEVETSPYMGAKAVKAALALPFTRKYPHHPKSSLEGRVLRSFAQRLQFRVAMPHDLVPRVRIFGSANVSAESGYKTHGITEPSGLGDSLFFA